MDLIKHIGWVTVGGTLIVVMALILAVL